VLCLNVQKLQFILLAQALGVHFAKSRELYLINGLC
jgi:hypothetical protein